MKKTGSMLFLFFTGALLAGNWNPLNSVKSGEPEIPKASAREIPASFKNPAHANYKSQIGFEENKGQWPNQVQFKADLGNGKRLFFEKNKFTYVLHDLAEIQQEHEAAHTKNKKQTGSTFKSHAFEMVFVNSNPFVELEGVEKNSFYCNYYLGNDQSKWASDVAVYKKLTYKNLYEGIDIIAYESENNFKYDYRVKKGADAGNIQLKFNGADKLEVRDKNLTILTSVGEVVESIPYAYQIIDGKEVEVACEYKLLRDGKTVVFNFPQGYDSQYELIIDPVLIAATYSGSTTTNYGHCATYDAAGNIYTGGRAFGNGYPVTTGAAQLTFGGSTDICISKLNPTGSSLLYATYLGGSNYDYPHSMFVNSTNELFVYGTTSSTNFPTSTGAFDNMFNGGNTDMYVSKFNTAGTSLLGSTFIGGSSDDGNNGNAVYNYGDNFRGEIIVGSTGDVFVVGTTLSTNFPVTIGAYDVSHNGLQDVVVLKMNSSLTSLTWATFLGGSGDETGCSMRVNNAGDIYVVGLTAGGFPIVTGAATGTYQGGTYDGYIARLNSSGTSLLNSTYIGTGAEDIIYFVELDYAGDVYVYGITQGTFPVSFGVYFNANSQNFLQKLNNSLSTVAYSTMLGNGTKNNFSPSALMVDLCQNIYMAGWGSNTGYSVTTSAIQATTTGSGFHIMVLSPGAQNMMFGSFFGPGGEHVDGGTSRFDPNGIVYQAVCEGNPNLPTTSTAYAPTKAPNASYDIAVFKIDFQVNCNPLFTNTIICLGKTATINIANVNTLLNPTFSIQPGGSVSTSPSFTVSPTTTTSYTVFITGTNGFNTIVTNSGVATVSIAPSPQVAPTFTQATCSSTANAFDLNLSFVPTTTTPTYVVFWSPIPYGVTTTTQSASSGGIAAGVYNATITVQPYGCKTSTSFTMNPVPTSVSFSVAGASVINCFNPTVTLNVSPTTYSYNWMGLTGNYSGSSASFTLGQSGTWTVNATDPSSGCGGTHTFAITQDLSPSTSTVTPLLQNITCSVTSIITVTATSNPTVNISHYWISPSGSTLTMNNNPALFVPGQPGTYTHVTINNINGCSDTKTFTVSSTSGFPTFSVSSPQNFTLGCGSKSLATIDIVNAQTTPTPGGAVTYTILSPASNTNYIPGTQVSYTVNIPGTYTVITKDNTNFCQSTAQISVLQNTLSPDISANVSTTLLNCYTPSVVLEGVSTNTNTTYLWSFPGNPGNVSGSTISVVSNSATISNTLIANYTLTITDNNNTCKSFSVIPMLQNLFPPLVSISGGGSITCTTPTLVFTNQASSSIPAVFPHPLFVQAYSWTGPSPQEELQLSTTYTVATPGTYTLIGRDLNNGCFAIGTKTLDDFRDYPEVLKTDDPFILDCGDNAKAIFPTTVGNTTGLTYSWTSVVGSSVSSVTSRTLSVNRSGQYSILITNTLNGCSSNAMLEVIGGSLQAAFVADQATGYAPLAVSFTNTSFSSSTISPNANIASYWNFGNATTYSSTTQSTAGPIVYTQPGTYKVVLYSIKGECLDSALVNIKVEVPSELSIPNIFTPNGDGNNDLFFLKATNLEKIDMMITDRWGNKVYELNSSTGNVAWDGKNQFGKESPAGVYLYTLKASGTDGTSYDKKGTITLVR